MKDGGQGEIPNREKIVASEATYSSTFNWPDYSLCLEIFSLFQVTPRQNDFGTSSFSFGLFSELNPLDALDQLL